jgi:ribosomal protein S18 acetylase RimI-like enzyme
MEIRKCGMNDIERLAIYNQQLIEDENSDNPMSHEELMERMASFIDGEYDAYFFTENGSNIGYALVQKSAKPIYLRHFIILREYRRSGFGSRAFQLLMETLGTSEIEIDVFVWNTAGVAFWKSCGFRERCFRMRWNKEDGAE